MKNLESQTVTLLQNSEKHLRTLEIVRDLNLPNCWIGAGFIRNLIWDQQHRTNTPLSEFDIDVVYFDSAASTDQDMIIQKQLEQTVPSLTLLTPLKWSVTNQAWIHSYNNELPYTSTQDAIQRWPETATCLAARLNSSDEIELFSAFGFEDAYQLILRPNTRFNKEPAFNERIKNKPWLARWPQLQILKT